MARDLFILNEVASLCYATARFDRLPHFAAWATLTI